MKETKANCKRGKDKAIELEPILAKCEKSSDALDNCCTFVCTVCKEKCSSRRQLARHIRVKKHECDLSLPKIVLEAVYHLCRLCNKKVLCDKDFLTNHIKKKHGMSVMQYGKQTQCDFQVAKLSNTDKWKDLLKASPRTIEVKDLCRYECHVCKKPFDRWRLTRAHYRQIHNSTNLPMAIAQSVTRAVIHTCKLCQKPMLCDKTLISNHICAHHNSMSLATYINLDPSQTNEEASLSQIKTFPSRLQNLDLAKLLTKSELSMNTVGDLCKYECTSCHRKFISIKRVRVHLKKTKHMPLVTSERRIIECGTAIVAHQCHLCRRLLVCDTNYLEAHFKFKHKISIRDYCDATGCKFFQIKGPQTEHALREMLNGAKISFKFEDRCLFKCVVCDFQAKCWKAMAAHKKTHTFETYHPATDFVKMPVAYACKLCKKKVLCDRSFITSHMVNKHEIGAVGKYIGKQSNFVTPCMVSSESEDSDDE